MRIIARSTLLAFGQNHPDAAEPLDRWYRLIKAARFQRFVELKQTFRSADVYQDKTVFNIAGNRYRLIAGIRYAIQTVYVHAVLTHADYDRGDWKHAE